jgi:6-phosphofructokinase 1
MQIAAEAIDRLHSTADSHNRLMIIEVMGHRAGWLALYAGIAGGGDIILIPEIPYSIDSIVRHLMKRERVRKQFSIVVVAEGALSTEEAELSKEERKKRQKKNKSPSKGYDIKAEIENTYGMDTRVTVLGHQQRGGAPSPYDRILATRFGTAAAELLCCGDYGKMVALEGNDIKTKPLEDVAGKLKLVPHNHYLIQTARAVGTCFGDD